MRSGVAAFILRFQESPSSDDGEGIANGTGTITAVHAEEIDFDPDKKNYGVFGGGRLDLGTITHRNVGAETPDEDPEKRRLSPIPQHSNSTLGTQTLTEVHPEGADRDPGVKLHQAIPPACYLS